MPRQFAQTFRSVQKRSVDSLVFGVSEIATRESEI